MDLKEQVWEENLKLVEYGLVIFTWGNVSAIDRSKGIIAIKPSGVEYNKLSVDDIVVLDVETGKVVEGSLNPSSDTPTHLELYRAFDNIGGVVHTHSAYATSFAQAGCPITAYGTTHGDYFYGDIPCTRSMNKSEIVKDYEANTGKVIVKAIQENQVTENDALRIPGILVKQHGPFSWGRNAADAVHNAVVMEQLALMAMNTKTINPAAKPLDENLLDKHFLRKHGSNAYYGQK